MVKSENDSGVTFVEFIVVALVITVLVAFLTPKLITLINNTRLENVRQDAAGIGAAIELLKIEGKFDPSDSNLLGTVKNKLGAEYGGHISDLGADGAFVYSLKVSGVIYKVRYDPKSGAVYEEQ